MRRRTTVERQLDLSWSEAMRWEDLPAAVRAQAQRLLGDLLGAVAADGVEAGTRDDHHDQ